MKKQFVLFILTILSIASQAQIVASDYDVIIADNTTTKTLQENIVPLAKPKYTSITQPGNLQYTNVIKDLPADAIDYVKKFSGRTNYITGIYSLGKKHFPKINKVFAKFGIPTEVNVLIALESYFNKNVVSKAKAVGYWQFIDATAIEYGLNISDSLKDERRDFDKSTKAAAKYLKAHYNMLGDWYLTVASYNCGIGNVRKAIKKTGQTKPSFFEVKAFLPKETQNYVMNYIALNIILKNYSNFLQNKIKWESTTQKIITPSNNIDEEEKLSK
jgi:membrane-bound lytic murein transglycosylase D